MIFSGLFGTGSDRKWVRIALLSGIWIAGFFILLQLHFAALMIGPFFGEGFFARPALALEQAVAALDGPTGFRA
jgi:hypothetical protein